MRYAQIVMGPAGSGKVIRLRFMQPCSGEESDYFPVLVTNGYFQLE